jgi:hypothetical protein
MCTYEPTGTVYTLDNGVPVPKKLAAELTGAGRLQADLFLRPNEDGLFPGFTQTWRAES